jgi:hypothetical protein
MAQVNVEPGKNQATANAVVTSSRAQPGSVNAETYANLVTVPYAQHEPGKEHDPIRN